MTLTLYNTLTRRKEPFQPIDPKNVRMYVCGPTVYDLAHIGNARPIIVFDVLFRLLRHIYGEKHVTYARNITDVDDKINARAVERYPDLPPTEAIRKLTEETTAQFHKDIAALGVLPPTVEPRATDHIAEMRVLCDELVANGHAYVAEDHVLFAVGSMPDYGKLARRSLEEMEAGARVDVAPYKRGPMDFVLWKPSKPGEPAWPSPAGIATPGRPGWHLECSAMAGKHLGDVFDIHGGGIDLVFPHHENEIAQSRCAHGTPVMANVWMHNGFLQVEGEKMSKSLGNFVTINELLETTNFGGRRWPGEVLRLAMLMTQYRQPIDFSIRSLEIAEKLLDNWYRVIGDVAPVGTSDFALDVEAALCDDLNTPAAITHLHAAYDVARDGDETNAPARFKAAANMLGLLLSVETEWKKARSSGVSVDGPAVDQLVAARLAARKAKDWKESDRIRDELAAMGIQLKDGKDPQTGEPITTWEVKR
ncbi:MAG TPA: cysteine--tRNA ligase [Hyphomicrobiaceae bacterium]|nr:cysteine--tRNA ligase [Hyphomicrobiaceae bacterium]